MSGDAFPGQLIAPNQSVDSLSDTRIFISNGPFQVYPNDTVKVIYALVSGYTVDDMLNNARYAREIFDNGFTLDVNEKGEQIPTHFVLDQNYPNPFNPATKIQFDIPKVTDVSLIVYDMLGREVARIVDETKPPGHYEIEWNGSRLASGVYFYRLSVSPSATRDLVPASRDGQAGTFTSVKKMLLVR